MTWMFKFLCECQHTGSYFLFILVQEDCLLSPSCACSWLFPCSADCSGLGTLLSTFDLPPTWQAQCGKGPLPQYTVQIEGQSHWSLSRGDWSLSPAESAAAAGPAWLSG